MKHIGIALILTAACATYTHAATERSFSETYPSDGVEVITFDAATGDFELIAVEDGEILVEVTLTPRRGGIFSSMKGAEDDVQEATLKSDVAGGRLYLEVSTDSGDRRFEERWTVHLPYRLGIEIEMGLGDVTSRGLGGGVQLEIGVGEVLVEATTGDIQVNVGVGEAIVKAPSDEYGPVKASGGVGDARIKVGHERIEGEGFVGHSATWVGNGTGRIDVEVGVGDARVVLE